MTGGVLDGRYDCFDIGFRKFIVLLLMVNHLSRNIKPMGDRVTY